MGIFKILGKLDPKVIAYIMYFEAHRRFLNLRNPKNLDEKINWMKFNTDTSSWSILADKYLVRDFIVSHGLEHTLNEIYGIFDSPDEIDFSKLPNSFVIKATNGSGGSQVMIIKDKLSTNWLNIRNTLNNWLVSQAPYMIAEPHYSKIKPRLIIEKYLSNNDSKSLIDYKFHCFNGKVESCLVCADRVNGKAVKSLYDLNWNVLPESVVKHYRNSPIIPRPKSLEKMIEYSQVLSAGFPYVRVDWYEIDGRPIFSELTFTPAGGYNKTMTYKYLKELGKLFILPSKL